MIDAIKAWLRAKFPPSIASVYQGEWNEARRQRQHAPFVVDRLDLFAHGIDHDA
jgi:hypothetical protein